ncbi:hypothetical protein HDV00_010371 [Rhizophlyctis rosea]|nr:hypothetical protein HDV00_010371 [Rhizophlyctis rosea]
MPLHKRTFYDINNQDELDKAIGALANKPDHSYHRIPQSVKDTVISELQKSFVEDILGDAYNEINPREEKPKKKAAAKKPVVKKSPRTPVDVSNDPSAPGGDAVSPPL